MITFYSGEPNKQYVHKDRGNTNDDSVYFTFSSTLKTKGNETLDVLLSQDFSGIYTPQDIKSATWVNLTDSVQFPQDTGILMPSKQLSLKPFQQLNNDTYIAFLYRANAGGLQKIISISNPTIQHQLNDGNVVPLLNANTSENSPGWTSVNVSSVLDISLNGSVFTFNATKKETTVVPTEAWLISGAVNLNRVPPDRGIPIQSIVDNKMKRYTYVFRQAGEYEVTFVAVNVAKQQISTATVKTLRLTVTN